ncbi:MAG: tripartite tricarboxylate transporter substrate binding protein, partial [Mesorhizobium sp.]
VFAPPGVSDADKAAMITLVETMAKSDAWATECKNRNWTQILLTGDDYAKFLAEDTTRIAAILKDLGLA